MDDVGKEGFRQAIKNMTLGDVKSKEEDDQDDSPSPLFQVKPYSSNTNDQSQANNEERSEASSHEPENNSSFTST